MENEKQRQKFYNFVNTKFINLSIMIVVFIFFCGINFINSCIRKKYNDVVLSQQSLIECKNISGYLKYQHIFAALENIIVIFIGFVIYKKITAVLEEYTNSISQNKAVEPKCN